MLTIAFALAIYAEDASNRGMRGSGILRNAREEKNNANDRFDFLKEIFIADVKRPTGDALPDFPQGKHMSKHHYKENSNLTSRKNQQKQIQDQDNTDTETPIDTKVSISGGASVGFANFRSRYLYEGALSSGLVIHGSWSIGLCVNRVKLQYDWFSSVDFQKYSGGFIPDDDDKFLIRKASLNISYNFYSLRSPRIDFFSGIGMVRLSSEEHLRDYPPYRDIRSIGYSFEGTSDSRVYKTTAVRNGINFHFVLTNEFKIANQIIGYWGLFTEVTALLKEIDGIEGRYSIQHSSFRLMVGTKYNIK